MTDKVTAAPTVFDPLATNSTHDCTAPTNTLMNAAVTSGTALKDYIQSVDSLLLLAEEESTEEGVTLRLTTVRTFRANLKNKLDYLMVQDGKWKTRIQSTTPLARGLNTEVAHYGKMAVDGYLRYGQTAEDLLIDLEAEEDRLVRKGSVVRGSPLLGNAHSSRLLFPDNQPSQSSTTTQLNSDVMHQLLNATLAANAQHLEDKQRKPKDTIMRHMLPKNGMDRKKYDGSAAQFRPFWTMFTNEIDSLDMPNITKFRFLVNLLEGPAADFITAYEVVSDNYPIALKQFKERYGDEKLIRHDLTNRLIKVEAKCGTLPRLVEMVDDLDIILGQMEQSGMNIDDKDLNSFQTEVMMRYLNAKVPKSIGDRLFDSVHYDKVNKIWTAHTWRNALKEYVQRQLQLDTDYTPMGEQIQKRSATSNSDVGRTKARKMASTVPTGERMFADGQRRATTGACPCVSPRGPPQTKHLSVASERNDATIVIRNFIGAHPATK